MGEAPGSGPLDAPPELIRRLDGVDGWLHVDEATELHRAALALPPVDHPLVLVEIGSWKGRSTISLASALELSGREGRVVAIDPHTGNVEHHRRWGTIDTYEVFLANLEAAGIRSYVEPLRMSSHEAAPSFEPGSIDLLFVDGSHEYEDVCRDVTAWTPLLRQGATVIYNDASWPGVYRALRKLVLRVGSGYREPRLVRSTLFMVYDPDGPPVSRGQWRRLSAVLAVRRLPHRVRKLIPGPIKDAVNRLTSRVAT